MSGTARPRLIQERATFSTDMAATVPHEWTKPRLIPNPECAAGKHSNCDNTAWDTVIDSVVDCPCDCHEPKELRQ